MNKKITVLLFALLMFSGAIYAQKPTGPLLADADAQQIIEQARNAFPKFYEALRAAQSNDTVIKEIVYIQQKGVGPGFAPSPGRIMLNLDYLSSPKAAYGENRLVVVLYHEIGHLHYFNNTPRGKRNPEDSEKAAFEYSLIKAMQMAKIGDCMPLQEGLKNMKARSEGNNMQDPHVRALKRLVNEPLYTECRDYVQAYCK